MFGLFEELRDGFGSVGSTEVGCDIDLGFEAGLEHAEELSSAFERALDDWLGWLPDARYASRKRRRPTTEPTTPMPAPMARITRPIPNASADVTRNVDSSVC